MIDLYYWPTSNGHKITIMLEETGLDYLIKPVDIGQGAQFTPSFLAIAPNNRMPAIVDHAAPGGAVSCFESGAILIYLAKKDGDRFFPKPMRQHIACLEWLMWQVGGLGPMAGQAHHFRLFAPEPIAYGIERYTKEVTRLYGVLDRRLAGRDFLADDYSIADMACYPWVVPYERQGQNLEDFPHLGGWLARIAERPAVKRAYARAEEFSVPPPKELRNNPHLYGNAPR